MKQNANNIGLGALNNFALSFGGACLNHVTRKDLQRPVEYWETHPTEKAMAKKLVEYIDHRDGTKKVARDPNRVSLDLSGTHHEFDDKEAAYLTAHLLKQIVDKAKGINSKNVPLSTVLKDVGRSINVDLHGFAHKDDPTPHPNDLPADVCPNCGKKDCAAWAAYPRIRENFPVGNPIRDLADQMFEKAYMPTQAKAPQAEPSGGESLSDIIRKFVEGMSSGKGVPEYGIPSFEDFLKERSRNGESGQPPETSFSRMAREFAKAQEQAERTGQPVATSTQQPPLTKRQRRRRARKARRNGEA